MADIMCKCPKCNTAFRAEVVSVHFVPASQAVCGVALNREIAYTSNPRRTTCCRCLKHLRIKVRLPDFAATITVVASLPSRVCFEV